MGKYEAFFVFPPEEAPEASKEEEKKIESLLTQHGGRTLDRQDLGRRSLGYAVRKFREGKMLLWDFEMEGTRLVEFRKALQLDEKILKFSIFRKAEQAKVDHAERKPGAPQRVSSQSPETFRGRQS